MSEQQRILEMIEKGQITAAEGMELLEAINMGKESASEPDVGIMSNPIRNYKYFKIKVNADNNSVNVNVNIPIKLLTTIGEIADKVTVMVPTDARKEMEAKGIDITSIDFAKIIEEILNGTIEDPDIIDIEVWDEEHQSTVKVKIYVE